MSSKKTLNPCPLCGKKIVLNRLQNGFSVEHAEKTDCELGRTTIYVDNYERATELWNMAKVSNGRVTFESQDEFVMFMGMIKGRGGSANSSN